MKRVLLGLFVILALLLPHTGQAQTVLNTTTLSGAINDTQTVFNVGSTANITVTATARSTWLFCPRTGELMTVLAVPQSGTVQVKRGEGRTRPYAAATSEVVVIVTSPRAIINYDLSGACTRGSGLAAFSPVINTVDGTVWVCRSSLWQGTNQTLITYNSLAPFTP